MSIQEAITIIKDYQIWRRGGTHPMPNPTYIGQAFDVLVAYVEGMEKAETLIDLVYSHPSVTDEGYEGVKIKKSEAPQWVISHFSNHWQ
jgi:hypothetical protein